MTEPTIPSSPQAPSPSPSPAPAAPVVAAPAAPVAPAAPEPWSAARPDFVPEQFKDAKTFGEHYSQIATRDAAEQVRRAALPQKAEDYKIGTTAAFRPPEGVTFEINEADPLWPQARAWAQKHGLSQDAFAEAVDLVAGSRIGDVATVKAAREAEVAKLGAAGPARIDAVSRFLDSTGAGALKGMLVTADIVKGMEALISKFSSQGAAAFSQAHRDAPDASKIPNFENMSFRERAQAQDRMRMNGR